MREKDLPKTKEEIEELVATYTLDTQQKVRENLQRLTGIKY